MDEKLAGLAHRMNIVLGQPQASHRNFQSRHWADLRKLGQPCKFIVMHADTIIKLDIKRSESNQSWLLNVKFTGLAQNLQAGPKF
jgi:hypothetical protein